MKAIWFGKHLYEPLLYLDTKIVEISPPPLNKGERQFVEDLRAFHDNHADFFRSRELYLLRNLSRGRGLGFFEAGNFHPDFILWLLADGKQQVIFVDPKGIPEPRSEAIQRSSLVRSIKEIETTSGRSGRAFAFLHRLEHSVHDHAEDVGDGEERDAQAARPFSGRGQGQLCWDNSK